MNRLAFIALQLLTSVAIARHCPNLNGIYKAQGEDGQVTMRLEQTEACNKVFLEVTRSYLGDTTRSVNTYTADNVFRLTQIENSKSFYMVASTFEPTYLQITQIKPFAATEKYQKYASEKKFYSLTRAGDLEISRITLDSNGDESSTDGTVILKRQGN